MLVPDRRRLLMDQVRSDGSALVDDLAVTLRVSAATIRRDLDSLAAEGLLLRTRGGAYLPRTDDRHQTRLSQRADQAGDDAKARIGACAAERITDGMTVMILAGSTTAAMLGYLRGRSVTVVTNGLDIAYALAPVPSVEVVILGGVLHREQMTFLGPMTEQTMRNLHVDIMFAGAHGVDPQVGVTGAKVNQAGNHHVMLQHATALVVLAAAAKFGRQGPTLLARIDQVHTFVTDSATPPAIIAEIRALGANVDIC